MPEGDTIHRAARTLAKAIEGKRVDRFASPEPSLQAHEDLAGRTITKVEARGKHLLVRFDDGRTLHTHMRMDGSWHIYKPADRWQRGAHRAVVVIETDPWIAVCFDAPIAEIVRGEPELVQRLGPDLLDPNVDLDEAMRRLRSHPALELGDALMRQDLVAGIGNVYKSETLFILRSDPFRRVGQTDDRELRGLLEEARRLMKRNLTGSMRATRSRMGGDRLWVYGRSGKPCFECMTPIRMRRQGANARSTYYCTRCQQVDARPHDRVP